VRARTSILVFGLYLLALGAILLVAPNPLLGLFGIAATHEVWIRVIGFLAAALGYYYLSAARGDVRPFFRWTVHARATVPLLFAAFVLLGFAPPALMAFAAVDFAGALWTALALRSDGRSPP
jgi:hypothetical protein